MHFPFLCLQCDLLVNTVSLGFLWQYHEGVRALYLAEKGGNVFTNFYDLGVYENLISVRLLILIPFLFW